MSKSFQISFIFSILSIILIFIPQVYIYTNILPTNPIYIGISLISFPFILGIIINQVPKNVNQKLIYLHDNYFSKLLELCYGVRSEFYVVIGKEMKDLIDEIRKYGKYQGLPCYPCLLLRRFDKYTKEIKEHNKMLDDFLKDFANQLNIDKDRVNIPMLNMVFKQIPDELNGYNQEKVNSYRKIANYVLETNYPVFEKLLQSNTKMREIKKLINDFHHFLKENSLIIPERRFGLQSFDIHV